MVVESIPIPLLANEKFRKFDGLIQRSPSSLVHASVVGRFFTGDKQQFGGGAWSWGGYGHMGCCSLLVLQEIVSVDPHSRDDLDYSAYPESPDLQKLKCGTSQDLLHSSYRAEMEAQQEAEAGKRSWAFDDARRVASTTLASVLKITEASLAEMKQIQKQQGQIIYEWRPKQTETIYTVIVSRPYWLSFYAEDEKKIAWIATAAYSACGSD
jgi:hypothetical protein